MVSDIDYEELETSIFVKWGRAERYNVECWGKKLGYGGQLAVAFMILYEILL